MNPPVEWIDEMHDAALGGSRMAGVADDPVLAEGTRRTNLANMLHWAAANVAHPGRRVPINLGDDVLDTARDLVRRGLDETSLDAYRTATNVAWRRWMQVCFGLTADPAELHDLLEISALSIFTFIDDTVEAMSRRMAEERADLRRGTHAERRATVALLLEGAPIPQQRAETQLGYRLDGPHVAAVVWGEGSSAVSHDLDVVVDELARSAGVRQRLTIMASAAALWFWLPVTEIPPVPPVTDHAHIRVAFGRPGRDLDGFRRSHFEALATQRLVAQLESPQQIARYDDVRLVSLLTSDPAAADDFVRDTLGALAGARDETAGTLRSWISLQCNTSRTAEQLYTHRNTVIRRLARAEELLPRPLADNLLDVAAALEILRWRG